ncbi:hypothetical protein VWO27_10435, partial [Campylobacter coli]|nr:hypothetical protein [Campylobacter coli]
KAPVHISYQDNEYAIIDKGLQNGDKIILDNFKKIRLGSEVKDGYCSIGKFTSPIAPAKEMIMATTEAKTGLSIKNLENIIV